MTAKVNDIEISMEDDFSDEQAGKMRVIKLHYDALTLCKDELDEAYRTSRTHPNGALLSKSLYVVPNKELSVEGAVLFAQSYGFRIT